MFLSKNFAKFHSVMSTKNLSENSEILLIQHFSLSFIVSDGPDQSVKERTLELSYYLLERLLKMRKMAVLPIEIKPEWLC